MASRDNSVVNGITICLSLCVIALGATTFWFFRSADENAGQLEAAKKTGDEWKKKFEDADFRNQFMQHVIGTKTADNVLLEQLRQGFSADEEMKKVDEQYEKFRKMFERSVPEGQQFSFLALPEILMTALRSKSEGVINLDLELNKTRADTRQKIAAEELARKTAEDRANKSDTDLANERNNYNKSMAATHADRDAQLKKLAEVTQSAKKVREDAAKMVQDREKEKAVLMQTVKNQEEKIIAMEPNKFEVAHGRIVWVNHSTKTVWINLGLADNLKRQVSFSVFDHESSGIEKAVRKGSIEVTQVKDQHLAEARITEEIAVSNPLLPGDQIFSPTWRPGRKTRFAMAGMLDINGDELSDRALLRSLITMNGGVIEAEVLEGGKVEGKITAQTNYFVAGRSPALDRNPNAEEVKQYNTMFEEARNLGVERISVDELVNLMGWKGNLKTISLGGADTASEYKARSAQDAKKTNGNGNGEFKERRPPTGANGAFE